MVRLMPYSVEKTKEAEQEPFEGTQKRATRRMFLAMLLLVALLSAHVNFTNKLFTPGLTFRIYNYAITAYSIGVVFYACYWWWLDKRGRRARELKANRAAAAAVSAILRADKGAPPPKVMPAESTTAAEPPKPSDARRADSGLDTTDELTGLLNWKGIVLELTKRQYSVVSGGKRARLLHIHVLNLSRINYEYGRTTGDMALKSLASTMKVKTPVGWAIGRLVGAEFLLIAASVTPEEINEVGFAIKNALEEMTIEVAGQRKVGDLRVNLTPVPYFPGWGSFQEALTLMHAAAVWERTAQRGFAEGSVIPHHVPQITLGAFAAHRWETLDVDRQRDYTAWRAAPAKPFVDNMAKDISMLLDLRAEKGDIAFVTIPPSSASAEHEAAAVQALGQRLAKELQIPFRKVLKAVVSGGGVDEQYVEPEIDTKLERGATIVLVCDMVGKGTLMRRCVRELSSAGCHVVPLAWAVRSPLEDTAIGDEKLPVKA